MKHIIQLVFVAILAATFCACSTSQTITIHGTPGADIYSPEGQNLGTIQPSGKLKVTLPDDSYFAYLLSQPQGADYRVPFALNFKHCNHNGTVIVRNLGYGLGVVGSGAAIVGLLASALADSDGADDSAHDLGIVALAGLGTALIGASIGIPAESRLEQDTYKYNFKYLKDQNANTDIVLQPLALYGEPKSGSKTMKQSTAIKANEGSAPASSKAVSSVAKRQVSERSTKTLRDYGSQIEGTYTGNGKLTHGSDVLEQYSNIKVILERVANDEVSVRVVEANGNEFFASSSQYRVEKKSNGSYSLVHEGVSAATITIDKARKLVYLHPRVNIDGDIYTLSITASIDQ